MAELWRQRNLETDKRKTVRSMLIKIEPRKEKRERAGMDEGTMGVSDVERHSIFFLSSI
jgi:hypothetical protein